MQVYAQQGDTVDDICFRHYGRTQQVVEMVYAANTGLAAQGPVLPHGYPVELPDLPESSTRDTLQLWD
ncbi:phage tail protein X [Erwinia toletana]|uniref:Phage tail protein X n=1 Tax=Winslowiella toletana TaxID=92490 RepID=A0ABS4P2X0_9GAMM|nr:tail protein X [Winslowiella toletana]MBP2167003.1 phage tail protein X [Winslowiella toletana]